MNRAATREQLQAALDVADPNRREKAVYEFGLLEDMEFLPEFLKILKDPATRVRWRAIQAIRKLNPAGVEAEIIPLLQDESPLIRAEAVQILGRKENKRLIPALSPLLDDRNLQVRCRVMEALGEIEDIDNDDITQKLISFLKDSDAGIRLNAALALGKCKHLPALPHLIGTLKDKNPSVRGMSAWSLGNLQAKQALSPLIAALEDDGESVRVFAYQAIAAFGTKAAEALREAQSQAAPDLKALIDNLLEDASPSE